jgi:hypothetical protein
MAYLIPSAKPQDPKGYNVEQAVGPYAPNAAGDVKLVQYMLKHTYGAPAANLKVDGFIGPTTISWIKRFQEDTKKSGVKVLVDSRIDRAFGQVSSISKTVYTILVLNGALLDRNPSAYAALPQHVPLSAKPKSNPYNPAKPNPAKPRTIKHVILVYDCPPQIAYVTYDDGSEETWKVQTSLTFPPGTPVEYWYVPHRMLWP